MVIIFGKFDFRRFWSTWWGNPHGLGSFLGILTRYLRALLCEGNQIFRYPKWRLFFPCWNILTACFLSSIKTNPPSFNIYLLSLLPNSNPTNCDHSLLLIIFIFAIFLIKSIFSQSAYCFHSNSWKGWDTICFCIHKSTHWATVNPPVQFKPLIKLVNW